MATADELARRAILQQMAARVGAVPLGMPSGPNAPVAASRPQIYPRLPSGVAPPAPYRWTPGQRPYVDMSRWEGAPLASTYRQAFTPMTNGTAAYMAGQQRAADRLAQPPPGRVDLYGGLHGRARALAYPDGPGPAPPPPAAPTSNLQYFQSAQPPALGPPTAGMQPFQRTQLAPRSGRR